MLQTNGSNYSFTYDQLLRMTEATYEGWLKADLAKDITSIEYNSINLPKRVLQGSNQYHQLKHKPLVLGRINRIYKLLLSF